MSKNNIIIGSVVVMVLAIGGIFSLLRRNTSVTPVNSGQQTNVSIVDGKQVIALRAKGGYAPRVTVARANMPTVINMETNGTFDCSSALVIPAVGFRQNLPASGTTPIDIPPQPPGTTIKGVCSMGMYSFSVRFE